MDERVDEAKNGTKKQPEPKRSEAPSRQRRKKFNDQLMARPELFELFESILALASDCWDHLNC